jgi:hypothetical protein
MFSVKRFIPYFKKRQAAGEARWNVSNLSWSKFRTIFLSIIHL